MASPSFNSDAEEEARRLQLEKMQMDLELQLSTATTADYGLVGNENSERARRIVENSVPLPVEIEKMTAAEAGAVRRTHEKSSSMLVVQTQKVAGFFGWLSTAFAGLFASKHQHKTPCDIYGHEVPVNKDWQGDHPQCPRCGTTITSLDMLRKCSPLDQPPQK